MKYFLPVLIFCLVRPGTLQAQVLTSDQRTKLAECELHTGDLESAIEMENESYNLAVRELKSGLFCSDCKRPKSEIERSEKKPFEKHIADGGPSRKIVEAPQEAYDNVYNKYKSKVDGYKSRLKAQREKCARMEGDFKAAALREKEREAQKKTDDANKAMQTQANQKKQDDAAAAQKQREKDAMAADLERKRQQYIAEQEALRQQNIQNLRSGIADGMSGLNAEAKDKSDQRVKKLAKDQDWIEQNNLSANQQLKQQEMARRQAQQKMNELNQGNDFYKNIQQNNNSNRPNQYQQRTNSFTANTYQKYEQAKNFLNDWRVKSNEVCKGSCFMVPVKVWRTSVKELKGITKDYIKLVTFPVSAPFELKKVNEELINGITNSLEDGEQMEAVIEKFKKSFSRMLPYGGTAERAQRYGIAQ